VAEQTDESLLDRLRRGIIDAETALFDRFYRRVLGLVQARLNQRAKQKVGTDAVANSVLMSFFDKHTEDEIDLRHEGSVWDLLACITLRHCKKWGKRFLAKKRAAAEVPIGVPREKGDDNEQRGGFEPVEEGPTADEVAQIAECYERFLQALSPRQQQIAELRTQKCTIREIVARLGWSQKTISRDLEQMRAMMDEVFAAG
jgi:hypothetical protein